MASKLALFVGCDCIWVVGCSLWKWGLFPVQKCVPLGVPQGPVLGPFIFLVMSKDFSDNLTSNVICYADDTRLHSVSDSLLECGMNMSLRTLRYGFKRIILSSMLKKFET